MDKLKDPLEEKLESLESPAMPAAVEARIRQRLRAEAAKSTHSAARRILQSGVAVQLFVLFALLLVAGWVFRQQVAPVMRQAWERTHCWLDPSAKKP